MIDIRRYFVGHGELYFNERGDYVAFADHERVVAEIRKEQAAKIAMLTLKIECTALAAFEFGKKDYRGCVKELISDALSTEQDVAKLIAEIEAKAFDVAADNANDDSCEKYCRDCAAEKRAK